MNTEKKIFYFIKSAINYFKASNCPYCHSENHTIIDRKYFVTTLLRCNQCKLMFRHPLDNARQNLKFYNSNYQQMGITTDLPNNETLDELKKSRFRNTIRSIDTMEQLFKCLNIDLKEKSLLDYGCSWGYSSWQFQNIGMHVNGYEISEKRAEFGKSKLSVQISTKLEDLPIKQFDFIYSSHVIEHLSDIKFFIDYCINNIKDNGYIILFCPNASVDFEAQNPDNFRLFWGQVHPNMISADFLSGAFSSLPFFITSTPFNFEILKNWDQKSQVSYLNGGNELLCIIKKTALLRSA
jgi:2-polyprenyl-3-methyl-5-hydroxy-6-metoxy-1,4-benzoquinol methylase